MRVIIKRKGWLNPPSRLVAVVGLSLAGLVLVGCASVFTFYYVRYSRLIDELLQGPVFPHVSQIYAASEELTVGEKTGQPEVVASLRSAGFTERKDNPRGYFVPLGDGVRIFPGPDSYFDA